MTSWSDARATAHAAATLLPAEDVPLEQAAGRVLAADVRALAPLPAFDTAAMDGWAVRGPGPWRHVGRLLAGDAGAAPLADGQALEVATGAAVPAGCEGVLPYEDGRSDGIEVTGPHPGGRHVRPAGEECPAGEVVLPAGTVLSAAAVGLAAAVGTDVLLVRRVPRVLALVTGSELLTGGLPGAGQVRDAVGPLLVPALTAWGARVVGVQRLPDDRQVLREALAAADADLVVTSGASSKGPADHLAAVLLDLGARLLVDGVAVKPGHPQVLAVLPDGRPVVGLPGNPLAALSGLVTLAQPLLAGLLGRPLPQPGCGRLAQDVPGLPATTRLVPVRLEGGLAVPTGHGGSAMLRGAAAASHLAVLPPGGGRDVGLLPLP